MTRPEDRGAPPPPGFEEPDITTPGFWDKLFVQRFMPWDQGGVPAGFAAYASRSARCPVLIPGCGSAYEAGWLAARGWPVTACDFALQAVAAARAVLGEYAGVVQQADFFDFTPALAPAWIYERAFLCALPPARRADYARRMAELLAPGGVLAGFFFIAPTDRGPPFSIEQDALDDLLAPAFDLIDDQPVADSLPVFGGRERWLTWIRRGA